MQPLSRYDRDAVSDPSRTLSVSEGTIPPTPSGVVAELTALSRGDGLSLGAAACSTGRLAAFLLGVEVVGLRLVPRSIRAVQRGEA